jgi:uncharacterized membrane protein
MQTLNISLDNSHLSRYAQPIAPIGPIFPTGDHLALSSASLPPVRTTTRSYAKPILWTLLGLAFLSVIYYSELPLRHTGTPFDTYRARLVRDRFFLFPHALCGTLALLSGPLQFSTRLRRKHLQFHRILGRVYVFSVLIAASIALILTQGSHLEIGTYVQSGIWIICTLAAFLTARNRQIPQHRQWMIRSYAVTYTFITLRVPNPWPAFFNMNSAQFTLTIIIVTFLSVFLADIAFNWRELTHRRA